MSAFSPLSSITSVSELTADSPASNFHESDPIHSSQPGYGTDAEHDDEDDQSTVPAPHKHDSTSSGTDSLLANPHGSDSSSSGIDEHAAAKTASWVSVFFLITTDILGPTSAPYAVSQLGYVPGIILFSVMGVIAGYTGLILWHLYLHLDRPQTPIRNFSALTGRIFGSKARVITNWLQSIQLLFNVSVIILGNAQGLSQIFNGKICFSVLALLWASWGMLLGQIKSLKNFTHLSNMAIWMNFLVIFITMAVIPNSEPNYASALAQNGIPYGPVETAWFIQIPFTQQVVGVCQIVYSFGGQLMFIELIAEMKNPRDFIKAALSAQTVILVCYLTFGVFCYHYQGQFMCIHVLCSGTKER
jgi:amino acid permease